MEEALIHTCKTTLKSKQTSKKKQWITKEVLELMKERRIHKNRGTTTYNSIHIMVKRMR